jgi:Uma2 family endonuclease
MNTDKRAEVLGNLHIYFTRQNMGFLMPYFGVLNKSNSGCFGPKKGFYSPDNAYFCKDETVIDNILSGKK